MDIGNLFRIRPGGSAIFRVETVDDEDPDRLIIKLIDENAPGAHQLPMRRHDPIHHQDPTRTEHEEFPTQPGVGATRFL